MQREIMNDLKKWKDKENRKPLLITGVRQCGKTYIIKEFGKKEFSKVAYLNLERNPKIGEVFKKDLDTNRIIMELSNFFLDEAIDIQNTLLILDEIQMEALAITSLKYFYEDMKELAIIGAGSLLGVSLRKESGSFPVGKIDILNMYPLGFKEFVLAIKGESFLKYLNEIDYKEEMPSYLLDELNNLYRDYLIVGGFPEAVNVWIDSKDIKLVNEVHDNLILGYIGDFSKHAPRNEITNLNLIWESIPNQLAKDNNKFIFSHVKNSARAKELETSLVWLLDAGLIHKLTKVENANIALKQNEESTYFKVYMCDTGLLCRLANFNIKSLLNENDLNGGFRGSLTENYVLNELLKNKFKPYYWKNKNTSELDFLVEYEDKVIPIEAKANTNTKAKSYNNFVKNYNSYIGFKFSKKNNAINMVENTRTFSCNLGLVWLLKRILESEID